MHDRPTALELVEAVRQFLESELLPTLSDQRIRFQTLIAANVLSIAQRELELEEADLRAECEELSDLLQYSASLGESSGQLRKAAQVANVELCRRIRDGKYDEPAAFAALGAMLRRSVHRKLVVANPRLL